MQLQHLSVLTAIIGLTCKQEQPYHKTERNVEQVMCSSGSRCTLCPVSFAPSFDGGAIQRGIKACRNVNVHCSIVLYYLLNNWLDCLYGKV